MQVDVILSPIQQRYVTREVTRLQANGDTTLTPDTYLARRLLKVLDAELSQVRVEMRTLNTKVLTEVFETLDPPTANTHLAPLGLQMDDTGMVTKVGP